MKTLFFVQSRPKTTYSYKKGYNSSYRSYNLIIRIYKVHL